MFHKTLLLFVYCTAFSAVLSVVFCVVLIFHFWKIRRFSTVSPFQSVDRLLNDLKTDKNCEIEKIQSSISTIKKSKFYFLLSFVGTLILILVTAMLGLFVKIGV